MTSQIKSDWQESAFFLEKYLKDGHSVIDLLSKVHDDWVKENPHKFNMTEREDKKFQHLPFEMIGWNEARADLLIAKPILKFLKIEIDEKELEKEYNQKVVKFFNKNKLINQNGIDRNAVAKLILKGHKSYAPLTDQNVAKNFDEALLMATQVCEKLKDIKF